MPAWRKIFAATAAVAFCTGASLAAIWAGALHIPFVRSPAPTGARPIGTDTIELAATGAAGARSLQVWYPAAVGARGATAPYVFRSNRSLRMRILSAAIGTHAIVEASLAGGRFPVVIYVPGWGGNRENNTALAEDLASNGYIVVAMNDPYSAVPMDFSSERAQRSTILWANRKVRLEVDDVKRIVDMLASLERAPSGRFARHLDLERLAILGFSFGGAVAAEAAVSDSRFVAVVNLDGWLFGDALRAGVPRPMLVMSTPLASAHAPPHAYANEAARTLDVFDRENERRQLAGLRVRGGFLVTLDGTDHYNFTDAGWLPTLRRTGLGSIDGRRASALVTAYVRQFFDRTLQDRPAPLFAGSEPPGGAARLVTFRNPLFGRLLPASLRGTVR